MIEDCTFDKQTGRWHVCDNSKDRSAQGSGQDQAWASDQDVSRRPSWKRSHLKSILKAESIGFCI